MPSGPATRVVNTAYMNICASPWTVFFERYYFSGTANNGQVLSVDDARQSGANIGYTYDALKRLTTATTTAWSQNIGYDGFGNITSKSVPSGSSEPAFPGSCVE